MEGEAEKEETKNRKKETKLVRKEEAVAATKVRKAAQQPCNIENESRFTRTFLNYPMPAKAPRTKARTHDILQMRAPIQSSVRPHNCATSLSMMSQNTASSSAPSKRIRHAEMGTIPL